MKRHFAVASLLLLSTPLVHAAQYDNRDSYRNEPSYNNNFSYTLGEVRLLAVDPDRGDNADGVEVGGWAQFHPNFFVAGSLSTLSQGGPGGLDTDRFNLGLGYRYAIAPRVDLVGIGGVVREDIDNGNFSDNDIGPSLTGGARWAVTPLVEFGGYVNYTDVFNDSTLGLIAEGMYHATPNLSLLAGLGVTDGERNANIGARWNFTPTRR
jgi:hypothetical protein